MPTVEWILVSGLNANVNEVKPDPSLPVNAVEWILVSGLNANVNEVKPDPSWPDLSGLSNHGDGSERARRSLSIVCQHSQRAIHGWSTIRFQGTSLKF